ncbi:MAG TPA: radical SAM protein [Candidatus Ozemobacteraceae bacterium]|nr:radical SAM protein [Candidatus Ozemobacteraceae bacterium]
MRQPTIEWQVLGACNYNCSYCIQNPKHRVGVPDAAAIDAILRFYANLPVRFEIKMSGGEPFTHPLFLDRIIPGLVSETPHMISVLTNLSAGKTDLERFAERTAGRIGIVSASMHLERVTPEAFIDRALHLRSLLAPEARLVVNSVLVPGRLETIARAAGMVKAAGLRFFPQLMKTKHGIAAYPDDETSLLAELLGHAPTPHEANLAPSYRGHRCHAGIEYFVVTQTGDVWSCRTARRNETGHLGNAVAGDFRPLSEPRVCTWDICPCTVPANRGMIEGLSSARTDA